MQPEPVIFTNARLVLPDLILDQAWIMVADGKIAGIGTGQPTGLPADEISARSGTAAGKSRQVVNGKPCQVVNLHGMLVMPGFIDLHTHGAGGSDFMDGDLEAWANIVRTHARHGTTSLLATTLASKADELEHTLQLWRCWQNAQISLDRPQGAAIIGLHLEGPYFSTLQSGAQDPRFIRNPDPAEYKALIRQNPGIRRWSAAPELPGALEFGKYASDRGILVSIAHSNAVYEEVLAAIQNGFSLVTHLYSATSGVTRINGLRHGGVIESALLLDELAVELIADGYHLPGELLRLAFRCKGPGRIALVTDSMRAAGTTASESILGSRQNGQHVIIRGGVARLPDGSALAGSIATTDVLLRTMHLGAGVGLCDVSRMMSATPARLLRLQKNKGSLEAGKDADLVILDNDLNVVMTIIGGSVMPSE